MHTFTEQTRPSSFMVETAVESNFLPDHRRTSFVGFDYAAAADRRQSLNFSPVLVRHNDTPPKEVVGPMVPPHILAANTVTDEAEAVFGSVPRNNRHNRPIEY